MSSLSLLLLSSSSEDDNELDESPLSDEESLEELSESLLLLLLDPLEDLDLFFFVFFSLRATGPSPGPLAALSEPSFSFFFSSAVLEGLYRYFLFPVHS